MTIEITLHVDGRTGYFSASSTWGQSAWHRDAMTALSELFSKAVIAIILKLAKEEEKPLPPNEIETSSGN